MLKLDKKKLPKGFDDRVKLTLKQKEEIRIKYKPFIYSYNILAEEYGVSKKLIILICNPDILEKHKRLYKERRKDGRYYNREKHTKAIRKLREKKKLLIKLNLL